MTVVACSLSLYAQNKTIHGSVVDMANNEPLIGATIMPVGGGQGTAADVDGKFTLTVPSNVTKATVTYVGYKPQTVELRNGMIVHLASAETTLDNVVVVAYGTANKESLTGSVAVVGAKEIEDRPVTSVTSALEGNAPGVQVNNTVGQPGSEPAIRIRGFNSINGSNDPIYVVDGVPFHGSIAALNPQDIESMSILKDAASAALYGNKGANGVVLITTRKAKKQGKVDVTLSIREGMYTRGISEYDRMGPTQWLNTMFQGNVTTLMNSKSFTDRAEAIKYTRTDIANIVQQNVFSDGALGDLFDDNGFTTARPLAGYTDLDWWNAVKQNGPRQEYNINAAAASDKYNVFASIGYLNEKGYIQCSDFERYSARFNSQFQPTSYFRFGANLSASIEKSEIGQFNNVGDAINPFLVQSMAPVYSYYRHNPDGSMIYDENGKPIWNTNGYVGGNVAYIMRQNSNSFKRNSIDGTLFGTAILPYGFEFTVRGNLSNLRQFNTQYMTSKAGDAMSFGGRLSNDFEDAKYYTFMQTLNWSHDYGKHHVDVLLDHENFAYKYVLSSFQFIDESFQNVYNVNNFNKYEAHYGGITEDRTESYLGRVRYDYNQKYFGEFSVRRDGTSRFSKDNRWGTFWSVGASWILSKEKFLQNVKQINFLKLRFAYGSVGNNNSASTYAYWPLYGQGQIMNEPFLALGQLAANNVKWEATKTLDVAVEGTAFDNRLNFSIGFYDKRNSDLLFNVAMPSSLGSIAGSKLGYLSTVLNNIGNMRNTGWELSFNGDIIRTKDVVWSASIDASFLDNKVLKLPDNNKPINQYANNRRIAKDHSIYEFYTYHWAGVDQMSGQSLYEINPNNEDFMANGEFSQKLLDERLSAARESGELVEYNGKYYTTNTTYATRDWCGTALPTVYGSFGTSVSWKGLSASILFTYSLGGKTYDSIYQGLMSVGRSASAIHKDNKKAWTAVPEGMTNDSPNRIDKNGVPQIDFNNSMNNNAQSDRWLTSASYLVLKNINISYNLPEKWMAPLQLQGINVGFSIDNLVTVAARKGLNPQQTWSGTSQSYTYNTPRVFTFQVTAKF